MTYLFVYLSAYLPIYLSIYLSVYLSIYPSIELAIHLLSYLSISTTNLIYSSRKYSMLFYSIPFVCMLFCLLNPSINLPINELINLSLHPCIHPATCVYAIIYMIHTHRRKIFLVVDFSHDGPSWRISDPDSPRQYQPGKGSANGHGYYDRLQAQFFNRNWLPYLFGKPKKKQKISNF